MSNMCTLIWQTNPSMNELSNRLNLKSTGLGISFQTLEMNCLWWTGFWGNTKCKNVSSPHYLKILMKLSKHGISYSLKCDPRSISKITFYANLRVRSIDTELRYFFKIWTLVLNTTVLYRTILRVKCDVRDWPWITFEAVADTMFPSFY